MNLHYMAISEWATPCIWTLNFSEKSSRELCANFQLAQVNKYTVGSINELFTKSDVEKLDWPSQKSDLNPNKIC